MVGVARRSSPRHRPRRRGKFLIRVARGDGSAFPRRKLDPVLGLPRGLAPADSARARTPYSRLPSSRARRLSKIGLRKRGEGSPPTPASTYDAATVGPRAARPSSSPCFGAQTHILAPAAQSYGLPRAPDRPLAGGRRGDGRRDARRAELITAARGRRLPADDAAAAR